MVCLFVFFGGEGGGLRIKRRQFVRSCCGVATYRLFKSLAVPRKPEDITFNISIRLMNNHENPKRNITAERFNFDSKTRQPNETIVNFVAELRQLSEQ